MSWLRYDIFISYSRQDGERVRLLVDELRRRGNRVFFDVESIAVGEDWKNRLNRSIRASRALVLCWSSSAKDSEFVHYELFRAEGLRKKVLPWLLDETPLPKLVELQGMKIADPAQAASALQPMLGVKLAHRRKLQTLVIALVVAAFLFAYWMSRRPKSGPPPWIFHGEVTELQTRMPIEGVEVVVDNEQGGAAAKAVTNANGEYYVSLSEPEPEHVHVTYRKQGYLAVEKDFPSKSPPDPIMEKLRSAP